MDLFLDYSQRISRAKNGGREAFGELYDWLVSPVYRYAWNQVRDQSAAEEICSEAFLVLVTELSDELSELPDADMAVMAWMRRVVRNKSVDWIRRNQVQRKALAVISTSGMKSSDSASPSSKIETQEECQLVHRVLHCLPSDYRDALELRYLDGFSVQQIATAMELSMSAANSLLFRARESFRKECDRQQGQPGGPSVLSSREQGGK